MRDHVTIVVLGDIGQSPRMRYHASSLASDAGYEVDFVGYNPPATPREGITYHAIKEFRVRLPRVFFPLYAPVKVLWLLIQLLWTLFTVPRPKYYLVQNPPSIPALAAVLLAARWRRSRVVIDWHNFGYTILELSLPWYLGFLARIYRWYERYFGCRADAHFCVTEAMRIWLLEKWGIVAQVLYDRAPSSFGAASLPQRHELFQRESVLFRPAVEEIGAAVDPGQTLFTQQGRNQRVSLRKDRPGLVISSTSWTADEDFGILLRALRRCDQIAKRKRSDGEPFPHLVFVITGKGPLQAFYMRQIAEEPFEFMHVLTMWLKFEDYATLLGSADLGVSLHKSSSGVDLPMKVVDMFGCGLPVCAVNYDCLNELVKHRENGIVFNNEIELSDAIVDLFSGFPAQTDTLDTMRDNVRSFQGVRWSENWNARALNVFAHY